MNHNKYWVIGIALAFFTLVLFLPEASAEEHPSDGCVFDWPEKIEAQPENRIELTARGNTISMPLREGKSISKACLWVRDPSQLIVVDMEQNESCKSSCYSFELKGLSPGRYDIDMVYGYESTTLNEEPIYLSVVAPMNPILAAVLLALGLVVALLVNVFAKRSAESARIKRRCASIKVRLRMCNDDNPLIHEKIKAIVAFSSWAVKTNLYQADLELCRRRVEEAEQLLQLIEHKSNLWKRGTQAQLSPSMLRAFYNELRLFDDRMCQLDLPMEKESLKELIAELRKPSENIVESAKLSLKDVNHINNQMILQADSEGESLADIICYEESLIEKYKSDSSSSTVDDYKADFRLSCLDLLRKSRRSEEMSEDEIVKLFSKDISLNVRYEKLSRIVTWSRDNKTIEKMVEIAIGGTARRNKDSDTFAEGLFQIETENNDDWLEYSTGRIVLKIKNDEMLTEIEGLPSEDERTRYLKMLAGFSKTYQWRKLTTVKWEMRRKKGKRSPLVEFRSTGPEAATYIKKHGKSIIKAKLFDKELDDWCTVAEKEIDVKKSTDKTAAAWFSASMMTRILINIGIGLSLGMHVLMNTDMGLTGDWRSYAFAVLWPFGVDVAATAGTMGFDQISRRILGRTTA